MNKTDSRKNIKVEPNVYSLLKELKRPQETFSDTIFSLAKRGIFND